MEGRVDVAGLMHKSITTANGNTIQEQIDPINPVQNRFRATVMKR